MPPRDDMIAVLQGFVDKLEDKIDTLTRRMDVLSSDLTELKIGLRSLPKLDAAACAIHGLKLDNIIGAQSDHESRVRKLETANASGKVKWAIIVAIGIAALSFFFSKILPGYVEKEPHPPTPITTVYIAPEEDYYDA